MEMMKSLRGWHISWQNKSLVDTLNILGESCESGAHIKNEKVLYYVYKFKDEKCLYPPFKITFHFKVRFMRNKRDILCYLCLFS